MFEPCRLGSTLELVLGGWGFREEAAYELELLGAVKVRRTRDRDLRVVEIGSLAHDRQRLDRLGRAPEVRDQRWIAGRRDNRAGRDGNRVHAVQRLHDLAAHRLDENRLHGTSVVRAVKRTGPLGTTRGRRTLVGSALLFGPALLLVPAAPQSQPAPFIVIALVPATFGGIVFDVTGTSLEQAVTPDRMLGRLNVARRVILWGVIPLGSLAGDALASRIGPRPTLWVGTIVGSVSFLPLLLSPVQSIGRMADAVRERTHETVPVGDA